MSSARVSLVCLFSVFAVLCSTAIRADKEAVLTLDSSSFADAIKQHPLVVVQFYAPWCGHSNKLAPEYEKAAAILSKNDPPIILAKVDANEEQNKELATAYHVKGFPTIKILRDGGKIVHEYEGPREADGIVSYLKKQSGPASVKIKSADDVTTLVGEKKIVIVGVFQKFSGDEYEKLMSLAQKLRSDYEFRHTLDAKDLPLGNSSVTGPLIRMFKPFDDLFVDSKEFNEEALEKFIEKSSLPIVTLFNNDSDNHPFVIKFFNSQNDKAMLFLNLSSDAADAFKSKYREVAEKSKGEGLSFLIGDLEAGKGALEYFRVKEDQVPLIIVQTNDGKKFLKPHLEPDHVAVWVKEYKDGKVPEYKKSEPIPEKNDQPVKVIVAESLGDMVSKSWENVLVVFYAPWCEHCQKLAPILDEVAVHFEKDPSVLIGKYDATANDVPTEYDVKYYPTLYFKTASRKLMSYDENDRSKEGLIAFIERYKVWITPT